MTKGAAVKSQFVDTFEENVHKRDARRYNKGIASSDKTDRMTTAQHIRGSAQACKLLLRREDMSRQRQCSCDHCMNLFS